jgi:hypothetical protein
MIITADYDKQRQRQKAVFIRVLREKGVIRFAAKAAGINRATAYRWHDQDEQFREDWNSAVEDCIDRMEASVYERALKGDSLLTMFWLKAQRPKFRDRVAVDLPTIQNQVREFIKELISQSGSGRAADIEGAKSINTAQVRKALPAAETTLIRDIEGSQELE